MKSISHGTVIERIRSAMKKTAPLSTPTSSSSRPGVVGARSRAPSSRIRGCSASSSIRTSPTAAFELSLRHESRSTPSALDDAGHRDDLVAAHDERPAFAVGARDLRVDEHVLDLLRAAGEPVAGPPSAYSKAWRARERMRHPPQRDLAVELDRAALEPEAVVLAHRLDAAAEVDALRADRRVEQLGERRRHRRGARRATRRRFSRAAGMDLLEQRQDLVADQAAHRVGVRRVDAGTRARARGRTPPSPRARAAGAGARRRPRGAALIPFAVPLETSR